MKRHLFIIGMLILFAAEIVTLAIFAAAKPETTQNSVYVNEIVYTVAADFDNMEQHRNPTHLNYVVINKEGSVLYKTQEGLSESIVEAINHKDTVVDVVIGDEVYGKVIVYNDLDAAVISQKRAVVTVLTVALILQCVICAVAAVYIKVTMVKPFFKLKDFAGRVAEGNLDIPLKMDKQNVFGAFTESFDIMRSELKKARLAEAQANKSKKELVAKLSHDIKTPVASIAAVAEVGAALAAYDKDRDRYTQIVGRANQIDSLVTNLFTATLEELQQLTVTPKTMESGEIKTMLENSDYLCRAKIPDIPQCLVYADKLRLQQVFDNIFVNSYKYADTDITVGISKDGDNLLIVIEDMGGGVKNEELNLIKDKYNRGENAVGTEGAGLGLYISDYFMKEMRGGLSVCNGKHGLRVTVAVALR